MTGTSSSDRVPRPALPGRQAGASLRGLPAITVLVLVLVLAATAGFALAGCATGAATPLAPASVAPVWVEAVTAPPLGSRHTAYEPARPAPELRLSDQDGRPFDLASLRGRPVLVYFGYTHCPDVCPTTLADLRAGIRASGVDATVVFVTVDPARDDAAAMKRYVDHYAMDFTGLTGPADRIAATAAAWGVTYQRLPSDSAAGYPMAHSIDSYLVDADGMLRHHVFFGAPADLIADRLREVAGR